MKKQLLMKTFLVAVSLLVGTSAWSTAVPYNVGSSTSDAWGKGFSDVWTLTGDGAVTVTFTNHCATDGNWWDNWQLLCGNESYTPAAHDNANRYFQMRSDRWDDAAGSAVGFIVSDDYFTDFKTFQNEATVTLNIVRSGTTVTVNTSVTKSETTRTMTFVKTGLEGTLNFFLTQSLSYMQITQQTQTTEMAGTVSANALINFDGATITSNTINGGLGTMSWSGQWSATPSIDSDMLRVGNMNDGTVALVGQPRSKDIVTISFDLGLVQLSGKNVEFKVTDKNSLVLVDEEFCMYAGTFTDGKNTLGFATSDFVSAKSDNPGMTADTKNTFTLTFNYYTRKIACSVINNSGTVNKQIDMPEAADAIASFAVRSNYGNASNANRRCYFDNLLIQTKQGDYNTTANITLAFEDNDGTDISALYTGTTAFTPDKSTTFTPSDYYPAVMYDEDYKYTYTSGGDAFTVTTDQVVTLVYTKSARPTYTFNVTANYGTKNKKIVDEISVKEAADYTYYYPRFILDGTTLYEYASSTDANASANYWTSTNTNVAANATYTLTYNAIDGECVYYSEGEDVISKTGNYIYSTWKQYMSNGSSGVFSAGTLTSLDAGVYSVTARVIGRASDRYGYIYKSSVEDANKLLTVVSANNGNEATANFTLTESTNIIAEGGYVSQENGHGIDYIYIMKLPSTVSGTITAAGWATYCSPYALDLEHATGLTDAYIVTGGADGVLTTTSVKSGTVPENTGLLIKGPEGTATIPVVATSETDVSANKLKGVTVETSGVAAGIYVLLNDNNNYGVGFYKTTVAFTVGANTAYLPTGFDGATARGFYSFGDATGVSTTLKNKEIENKEVYNLKGQRVAAPTKGLYIVNGKKIVVK